MSSTDEQLKIRKAYWARGDRSKLKTEIALPAYIEVSDDTFKAVDECSLDEMRNALKRQKDIDIRAGIKKAIKFFHGIDTIDIIES